MIILAEIKWFDWCIEAFEKAKKENKPILMDIYGVWCHWCHRIDKDTYSVPEIANFINKNFIPIRVDTDKRPDINSKYNQGGWPSTVFLTSDGKIITGATYEPPEQMKILLKQVADFYKTHRRELETQKELKIKESKKPKKEITREIIETTLYSCVTNFDFDYGGFGGGPKFPMPGAIDFLILRHQKTKDKNFMEMVTIALEGMLPLMDSVYGGFFRYSVTRDWKTLHFEKMLESNVGIIKNYLNAFVITKNQKYKEIALKNLEYIKKFLSDKDAGFYGSQEANEEFYKLSKEERGKIKKPKVDKTIYTDLNSEAISTFLLSFKILNQKYYKEFALKTIDFLVKNVYDEKNGVFHYFYNGQKFLLGITKDHIYLIKALLDAYGTTKNKEYLKLAEKISKFLVDNFYDKKNGGFFDKFKTPDDIGYLAVPKKQIIENSVAAENFLRLFEITKKEEYMKIAEETLKAFVSEYDTYGYYGSYYAMVVENFLSRKG